MKKTILASLIGAGALLASTASMAASVVLPTQSIGPDQLSFETHAGMALSNLAGGTPNAVAPVSFAQFDSTLGTLTQVLITVGGSASGTLGVTNSGSSTIAVTALSVSTTFQFDLFDDDTVLGTEASIASGAVGAAGVTLPTAVASGATVSGAAATSVGPSVFDAVGDWGATLADFIGAGTWDFGCAADNAITVTAVGGSGEGTFDAGGQCDIGVEYIYTAVQPAPIPGSLLLMAAGLLGFGASRRK